MVFRHILKIYCRVHFRNIGWMTHSLKLSSDRNKSSAYWVSFSTAAGDGIHFEWKYFKTDNSDRYFNLDSTGFQV